MDVNTNSNCSESDKLKEDAYGFVEILLSEVERVCRVARLEETGGIAQRALFEELEDLARVLQNPTILPDVKKYTTNQVIYQLANVSLLQCRIS
jgi:hypothetical protein